MPEDPGVESNARLTATVAVILLGLLAVEGLTILRVHKLLTLHVFVGMLLIPPVLLKIGTTTYRFVRYYLGAPGYRRRGPPPVPLRVLGPLAIATTVAVFASGVALLFVGPGLRSQMLLLHKLTFVVWFAVMTVHVLAHLLDTARLAPLDWARATRRQVKGAGLRQWAVAGSLALGIPLALLVVTRVGPWLVVGAR